MSKETGIIPVDNVQEHQDMGLAPMMPDGQGPNLLVKFHSVMRGRYWIAIILAILLAGGGAAAGWFIPKPVWRAQGLIQIDATTVQVLPGQRVDAAFSDQVYESFVASQVALIMSPRVIDAAIKQADWGKFERAKLLGSEDNEKIQFQENLLATHKEKTQDIVVRFDDYNPEAAFVAVQNVIQAYDTFYGDGDVQKMNKQRDIVVRERDTARRAINGIEKQIEAITTDVGVDDLGPEFQIRVSDLFKHESRLMDLQAELVKTVGQEGMQEFIKKRQAAAKAAADALQDANAPKPPADAAANPAANPNPQNPAAPNPVAVAEAAPEETGPKMTPEQIDQFLSQSDPKMKELIQYKIYTYNNLQRVKDRYGAKHRITEEVQRTYAQAEADLEKYRQTLIILMGDDIIKTSVGGPQGVFGRQRLEAIKKELEAQIVRVESLRKQKEYLGKKMLEIKDLQRDIKPLKENLQVFEDQLRRITAQIEVSRRINIRHYGRKPLEPYTDLRKLFVALGGVGGIFVGFMVVFLFGLRDTRLRFVSNARSSIGQVTMLGVLPTLPDDLEDPIQAKLASHCVHQIRTLMQIRSGTAGSTVYAVTSPSSGDGKTSLVLSLGLSFAAAGKRTLMIDSDFTGRGLSTRVSKIIRRRIGSILQRDGWITEVQLNEALRVAKDSNKRLGEVLVQLGYLSQTDVSKALTVQENSSVGVLDVLHGEALADCVTSTGIDGLSILPIGGADSSHAPMLSPNMIRRILNDARSRYDVVVVDTGPVPDSVEASLVAAEADDVVLVVSSSTQRKMSEAALDHLFEVGASVQGVVFNRANDTDVNPFRLSTRFALREDDDKNTPDRGNLQRLGPVAGAVATSASGARDKRSDKSDS